MRNLIKHCLIPLSSSLNSFCFNKENVEDLTARTLDHQALKPAAVLLPLIEYTESMHIILTKRTDHLYHHPGQVCFPGGTCELEDQDFIDTALRETEEEIGLSRHAVDIAGFLDPHKTSTGFLIMPVVGFIEPHPSLIFDSFEVAEIFELPLTFVLDARNRYQETVNYQGKRKSYYVINYQNYVIWGATAAILVNFCERLQDDEFLSLK